MSFIFDVIDLSSFSIFLAENFLFLLFIYLFGKSVRMILRGMYVIIFSFLQKFVPFSTIIQGIGRHEIVIKTLSLVCVIKTLSKDTTLLHFSFY